jgi:arginyl-tRNA synthetase
MNIFQILKCDILDIASKLGFDYEIFHDKLSVEIPKDRLHGDLSTNIAMLLASQLKQNPREIAIQFINELSKLDYVANAEVAGAGFINFTIKSSCWCEILRYILNFTDEFSKIRVGDGLKINVEYVSANPTGPLHVGHARGAVYGDVLSNVLEYSGYSVTREYYINDAGNQVNVLAETALLRYKEILHNVVIEIPQGLYPGSYMIPVGQGLFDKYGPELEKLSSTEQKNIAKDLALQQMMSLIKADLSVLGISHDVFFSENSLHESGLIDSIIPTLSTKDLVYRGILPTPKGKADDTWEPKEQTLFRSTNFGDDQDRVVQKSDGSWTYFASDLAYAKNKIDRGFQKLIYILGADHGGYVKRIKGIIKALSDDKVLSEVLICQMVNFMDNGVPIKMSKRSGNFATVKDVIDAVGSDVVRFMMLMRKNDAMLDFDLQKVCEQSKDNPIFYVQYAHVRTVSLMQKAMSQANEAYLKCINGEYSLELLSSEEEINLIKLIASWPKILESAAISCEPHKIALHLYAVASEFHGLWNLVQCNEGPYRFIIDSEFEITASRLALVLAVQKAIKIGLDVIGITPIDQM